MLSKRILSCLLCENKLMRRNLSTRVIFVARLVCKLEVEKLFFWWLAALHTHIFVMNPIQTNMRLGARTNEDEERFFVQFLVHAHFAFYIAEYSFCGLRANVS